MSEKLFPSCLCLFDILEFFQNSAILVNVTTRQKVNCYEIETPEISETEISLEISD